MRDLREIPRYSSEIPASGVRELWRYRGLLWSLVVRDLKVKYQRSFFGFVWTLFNPLATVLVLVAVFSMVVRIPVDTYWAFLISGYFTWNFVSQVISSSPLVMESHAGLIRSVPFPKDILILSGAVARLVEFVLELLLVVLVLVVFHHGTVPASLLLLPLLVVPQFLLAVGLAMPVATLSVYYYDVRHTVPIVLMILFYGSPVFYPVALVPEQFRGLYALNPLTPLLTAFHEALYHGAFPALGTVAVATSFALIVLFVGHAIFNRYKARFPELL